MPKMWEISYLDVSEQRLYTAKATSQIEPLSGQPIYTEKEGSFTIMTDFKCPLCSETIIRNPENDEVFLFLKGS